MRFFQQQVSLILRTERFLQVWVGFRVGTLCVSDDTPWVHLHADWNLFGFTYFNPQLTHISCSCCASSQGLIPLSQGLIPLWPSIVRTSECVPWWSCRLELGLLATTRWMVRRPSIEPWWVFIVGSGFAGALQWKFHSSSLEKQKQLHWHRCNCLPLKHVTLVYIPELCVVCVCVCVCVCEREREVKREVKREREVERSREVKRGQERFIRDFLEYEVVTRWLRGDYEVVTR